jgi:fructose-1,6-bisphosphatase/inositol monophosphatase family enzyme
MIIDEEKISKYGDDIFDKVNQSEYQFVIDPVDGTIQYANGHHLFGITIGVYKNATPFMGIIYMPKMKELLYFDGTHAYHIQNPFTDTEIKTELLPHSHSFAPIAFANQFTWDINNSASLSKIVFFNYFSAVSQCFYTLVGKSRALCMKTCLWDISGTIPIADYLGIKIFEYGTKKIYNSISPEYFNTDMSTKKHCIMCYPENYDEIASLVTPKQIIDK